MGVAVSVSTCSRRAPAPQLRLLLRAEALFLVHHQQAEVVEPHALRRERMGADGDMHLALGDSGADGARLGRRGQAGERLDRKPKPSKRRRKVCEVLAHQHRGRRQQRHLLPASAAAAAARSATSVLPKPTSPQTRRSIGLAGGEVGQGRRDRRRLVRVSS